MHCQHAVTLGFTVANFISSLAPPPGWGELIPTLLLADASLEESSLRLRLLKFRDLSGSDGLQQHSVM